MNQEWRDRLVAWLHDPPDKAAGIPGHEGRACRIASAAVGDAVTETELKQHADAVASALERLPMPTAGNGERAVGPDDQGRLTIVHPLSGVPTTLGGVRVAEDVMVRCVSSIVGRANLDTSQRFLALWRLLPDLLAKENAWLRHAPADTRTPDHTIWQHLDMTAGLAAAGKNNAAFLAFSLGPVQSFISASRSLRDLWTGSMILSWLTFQAMLPIINRLGPTALVYPALRGQPLLDLYLREKCGLKQVIDEPSDDLRRSPCLPNRFLAVVPNSAEGADAASLARECENAARSAWRNLCHAVRVQLDEKIRSCGLDAALVANWDRHWAGQVDDFFEFRTVCLPFNECQDNVLADLLSGKPSFDEAFENAARVRGLADAIPPEHAFQNSHNLVGHWQHRLELCMRLLAAAKSIRNVPPGLADDAGPHVPAKCSLLGSYEQMGPGTRDASREFWNALSRHLNLHGARLREGERLCAIALVKRFAGPAFFRGELRIDRREMRLDDTATIAAAEWLDRAGIDHDQIRQEQGNWSGQWLHREERGELAPDEKCPAEVRRRIGEAREKPGPPPAYYAVLMLDGDQMGEWLRGALSPPVGAIMHGTMEEYFNGLRGPAGNGQPRQRLGESGLRAARPVGPALHAAISAALANFALHVVPGIVREHHGELIYAGGDDVLALLPVARVLSCAHALYQAFRADFLGNGQDPGRLMMGSRATLSAGVAVVHHKEDLRYALERARRAEKAAKNQGRNALVLAVCRRSGEHAQVLCPWGFVPTVERWIQAFIGPGGQNGASDRWVYHLRDELPTLKGIDVDAMRSELSRQIGRAELPTRKLFGENGSQTAGHLLAAAFDEYRGATHLARNGAAAKAFEQFVLLCQAASFLARGRDR